mmetsp:Transcript_14556/g.23719  ORF Transcript_14556/g.23719 Transcript_14556/m.23719 type:complete len:232 (-) Transcript_14556:3902-4597(-)
MKLDIALTLSALFLCKSAGSTLVVHPNCFKFVITCPSVRFWIPVTLSAKIKVGTGVAMMAVSRSNFSGTRKALLHELGSLTILQMPQDHHRRVLGSSEFIKLIVISTTEIQEALTCIEEFAINFFGIIIQYTKRFSVPVKFVIRRGRFNIGRDNDRLPIDVTLFAQRKFLVCRRTLVIAQGRDRFRIFAIAIGFVLLSLSSRLRRGRLLYWLDFSSCVILTTNFSTRLRLL